MCIRDRCRGVVYVLESMLPVVPLGARSPARSGGMMSTATTGYSVYDGVGTMHAVDIHTRVGSHVHTSSGRWSTRYHATGDVYAVMGLRISWSW